MHPCCHPLLQVQLQQQLGGLAGQPASRAPSCQLSISSNAMLECTIAPAVLSAAQQLNSAVQVAQQAAKDPDALLQQQQDRLLATAAPSVASPVSGCWLLNQTGLPLQFSMSEPGLGGGGSSSLGSGGLRRSQLPQGGVEVVAAGQMAALELWDLSAAQLQGRYVEQEEAPATAGAHVSGGGGSGSGAAGTAPAARSTPTGRRPAAGRRPGAGRALFLQLPGQQGLCGPINVERLGCGTHMGSLMGSTAACGLPTHGPR